MAMPTSRIVTSRVVPAALFAAMAVSAALAFREARPVQGALYSAIGLALLALLRRGIAIGDSGPRRVAWLLIGIGVIGGVAAVLLLAGAV